MAQRTHTIGTGESYGWPRPLVSGHQIQRIVGLPLSWVEPAPRATRSRAFDDQAAITWQSASLIFDEPTWDEIDDRTPLDMPDDGIDPCLPQRDREPYDGFPSRDTQAPRLPRGKHSRPQKLNPADLERMADQILDAADANLLRTPKPLRVPGLPDVDERGWRYLPYTYTLGWKDCPRCDGGFAAGGFARSNVKRCNYCSAQGGWQITRTTMTPWHPQHGWALTPPRLDGAAVHRSHWRTRSAAYTGNVRIRERVAPSEAIMAEIRRRYRASRPSEQTRQAARQSLDKHTSRIAA